MECEYRGGLDGWNRIIWELLPDEMAFEENYKDRKIS
jgi:hypothetical protein